MRAALALNRTRTGWAGLGDAVSRGLAATEPGTCEPGNRDSDPRAPGGTPLPLTPGLAGRSPAW